MQVEIDVGEVAQARIAELSQEVLSLQGQLESIMAQNQNLQDQLRWATPNPISRRVMRGAIENIQGAIESLKTLT